MLLRVHCQSSLYFTYSQECIKSAPFACDRKRVSGMKVYFANGLSSYLGNFHFWFK